MLALLGCFLASFWQSVNAFWPHFGCLLALLGAIGLNFDLFGRGPGCVWEGFWAENIRFSLVFEGFGWEQRMGAGRRRGWAGTP